MPAGHLGHDELGAHAVGAGDQHRFAVSERGEVEQAAEAADAADHAGAFGACHMGFDALDDLIAGFDADSSVLIRFGHDLPFLVQLPLRWLVGLRIDDGMMTGCAADYCLGGHSPGLSPFWQENSLPW